MVFTLRCWDLSDGFYIKIWGSVLMVFMLRCGDLFWQFFIEMWGSVLMVFTLRCGDLFWCFLLKIGSIRIYILMTGSCLEWNKRRCTYVHWRIYSSRDLDTLLYKVELELNMHWKNAGLYTLATKDWDMWELLLGANWQVRINRITMTWETVTLSELTCEVSFHCLPRS